jgi:tetratricopeptide (TPR) repeat protein/SAM-dependent methyltransferase
MTMEPGKKSFSKKVTMDQKKELEKLQELLVAYGDADSMQEPEEASTDNQLKSLTLVIEEVLHKNPQGTVLDIGCGKGVLLSKLAQLPSFRDNSKWHYLGADYSSQHDFVLQFAASLRLHRRCDVIDNDALYASWVTNYETPLPLLIFIRNVFHEMKILDTARLLHLLHEKLDFNDTLLIQDLLVFPMAERGNVCWDSACLSRVFDQIGFDAYLVEEPSRSGAQWFSAKVTKRADAKPLLVEDVHTIVANGRLAQLEKWRSAGRLTLRHSDSRFGKITLLDFDLQTVGLYQQLEDAGFLSTSQQAEKPILEPSAAMQLALSSYDPSILDRDKVQLPAARNFRDRKHSQDELEVFLNSEDSVVVIQGGTSCGKSVLVSHVLSRRARGRSIVPIDCETALDIWPMLEQYLLAIGCRSSLEILSREKILPFESLRGSISTLVGDVSQKSIIVFDHFEKLIDPNGQVLDLEISQFLTILASADGAKVVITTRKEPALHFLPETVGVNTTQPPVGRFPVGPYVENLLDDYVDRRSIGIEHYPTNLLDAIDRFPYLATLAGKLVAEAGIAVAEDPEVLRIIRLYLFDELARRIATPEARPALQLACLLRIPAPRILFEGVVGATATVAAVETGLLYSIPDRYRGDLLSCASVLRDPDTDFDSVDDDIDVGAKLEEVHSEIAKWYAIISKDAEGDPRWIREAHYHTLASGDMTELARFGSLYKAELFWAARTWFRRYRDYEHALEALLAAETMGLRTYETRMLTAACLVRVGKRSDGETRYRELIADFPNQEGVKTSLIDSLLRIGENNDALTALEEFGLSMYGPNPWVAGQYGRAYLGLHNYTKASEAFKLQLKKYTQPPAIVFVRLAQSYFQSGERTKAQKTVTEGLEAHGDSPALNTLHCANLLRSNTLSDQEEAEQRLEALADVYPRNGYVLQKLVTASALLGHLPQAIARLDRIQWRVEPPNLEKPVRIAVFLAQRQFRPALEIADTLSTKDEYGQAIMRKVFLKWASAEKTVEGQRRIAEKGLEREVPQSCLNNVPILTMYSQLARIAGDTDRYDQVIKRIREINIQAAENISGAEDLFDVWEDFEPELP